MAWPGLFVLRLALALLALSFVGTLLLQHALIGWHSDQSQGVFPRLTASKKTGAASGSQHTSSSTVHKQQEALTTSPGEDSRALDLSSEAQDALASARSTSIFCRHTEEDVHTVADDRGKVCARDSIDWRTGCCKDVFEPELAVGDKAKGDQNSPMAGDVNQVQQCSRCSSSSSSGLDYFLFCCESFADCVACCLQQQGGSFFPPGEGVNVKAAARIGGKKKEYLSRHILFIERKLIIEWAGSLACRQ